MEKESLFEDITHDDDQLSTKTTQDREDDGIMETEDFEKKREFIRRQRVSYFIFDRWCVMINVSFRIQSGVLCFWGGFGIHLNKILHYSFFLRVL